MEETEADVRSHADCRGGEASERDSFVDIMGSLERDSGGGLNPRDSRLLTSCCTQICYQKFYWRALSIHLKCHCVSLQSSFHWLFCWINKMAIHVFHKLVNGACLYMKMSSRGCSVLLCDSSGELALRPEETSRNVPCSSGIEFVVGCATSDEEVFGAIPLLPWRFRQVCSIIVLKLAKLVQFVIDVLFFQVPLVKFNVSPELLMCRQKRK